jgi:hypothetical protein
MVPVCRFEHATPVRSYPSTAVVGKRHVFAVHVAVVDERASPVQVG